MEKTPTQLTVVCDQTHLHSDKTRIKPEKKWASDHTFESGTVSNARLYVIVTSLYDDILLRYVSTSNTLDVGVWWNTPRMGRRWGERQKSKVIMRENKYLQSEKTRITTEQKLVRDHTLESARDNKANSTQWSQKQRSNTQWIREWEKENNKIKVKGCTYKLLPISYKETVLQHRWDYFDFHLMS